MQKYFFRCLVLAVILTTILSGCGDKPTTYNVSGYVALENTSSLEGVTINFSGGFSSVSTDPYGQWFKNDLTGTVTVTPVLTGYNFNPTQLTVDSKRGDVNFVAIPYKIAYIYNPSATGDETSANNFKTFLDPYYPTDLVIQANIESTDFSSYSLIIIGRGILLKTPTTSDPTISAAATYIHNTNLPVIGLTRGGLTYFANVTSTLKGENVASNNSTQVTVLDATLPIWSQPNNLNVATNDTLTIFNTSSHINCFYYPYLEAGGIHIARFPETTSYDTINQVENNLYWAYYNDASDFTTAGQNLFLNAISYMIE